MKLQQSTDMDRLWIYESRPADTDVTVRVYAVATTPPEYIVSAAGAWYLDERHTSRHLTAEAAHATAEAWIERVDALARALAAEMGAA